MTARRAEIETALNALDAEKATLAVDALDAGGFQTAQVQLSALELAAKDAEGAHLRATTELGTIDVTALTTEKNEAVLQAALAQNTITETQDFQLSPEERIRFETRLTELDAAIPGLQQECARLEVRATAEADIQNQRAEVEERLAGVERQLQHWQQRLRVDTEIRTLLDAARGRAVSDLTGRHLPNLVGRYLAQATGNRHADVRAGGEGFEVWSTEKGTPLEPDEFSTGTRDQFYLAVRLAHLEALFPTERPPLLLDDPLVHCDPARRGAVLRLLADYATTGQVLLFTCHEFSEYQAYPILEVTR
jgi:DNA repair exonuclease SbcCD ATPase subunit